MNKTFLFTLFGYRNGSWTCLRQCSHVDAKQKRRLVRLAKQFGYKYVSSYHAYVQVSEDCLVSKIAYFTEEQ